jgi:hypothetical protein
MNSIESIQLFFDEHQELETEARINLRISERINFIEILQNFDLELFKFRQEIQNLKFWVWIKPLSVENEK